MKNKKNIVVFIRKWRICALFSGENETPFETRHTPRDGSREFIRNANVVKFLTLILCVLEMNSIVAGRMWIARRQFEATL